MTETAGYEPAPRGSLSVMKLFSDSLSIFMKGIWLFVPASIVILVALNWLNYSIFGATLFLAEEELFSSPFAIAAFFSSIAIAIFGSAILVTFLAVAAYDTVQGRPVRVAGYVAAALRFSPIVIVLTLVSSIAFALGLMLFLIPGIILYVMWVVMTPAVVIEGAGFGALKRSAELTKGYRWPIFGFLVLMFLAMSLIVAVLGTALGFGFAAAFDTTSGLSVLMFQACVNAVATAFFAVAQVVLFGRLKELKEGVGMADVADIFE